MHKRCLHLLGAIALLAWAPSAANAVALQGRIARVGFPGSSDDPNAVGADHYRPGSWVPVVVELLNADGDLFQGTLEVTQPDRDGDEIVVRPATAVSVRGSRTYQLYIPAHPDQSPDGFGVRVLDEDGRLVELANESGEKVNVLIPARPIAPVQPARARVILDISEPALTQLKTLTRDARLVRDLFITRISASGLPDNPAGLDMVDTIIWDGADPSGLDPAQVDALIGWVRRGGTLLLGVSRKWELVSRSKLGAVLPAKPTGVGSSTSPAELGAALYGDTTPTLSRPLEFTVVRTEHLASDALPLIPPEPEPKDQVYLSQRPHGRGTVLLSSSQLQDLLAPQTGGTQNADFLRQILGIRRVRQSEDNQHPYMRDDLFRQIERVTGFRMQTGLYFLIGFLFVVGYILLATAGIWNWLKRKNLQAYAWPAFAAAAVLASAGSLGAVQIIRGSGYDVEQLTILDGQAGSDQATAVCYIGLKTSTHTKLDLCLPSDWQNPEETADVPGGLSPLPPDTLPGGSRFVAGERYFAVPGIGHLHGVPFRATLKQLQGVWEGRIPAGITASLTHPSGIRTRLTPSSWIKNEMSVDLTNCHLFLSVRDIASETRDSADRSMSIYVYPVGKLAAGETLTWGSYLDRMQAERRSDVEYRAEPLSQVQGRWFSDLNIRVQDPRMYREERPQTEVKIDHVLQATMLLTLLPDLDQNALRQSNFDLTQTRGLELDRSMALTTRMAILVGLSENEPGPARLCLRRSDSGRDWRAIEPARSTVIYRFSVPVAGGQ